MTAALAAVLGAGLFLAFANGANDNFKGVATLYGSGLASFRGALAWASLTTFAGALTATLFAGELIKLFSGSGLVPEATLQEPAFLAAVVLAAGLTVFVTARFGVPISTTHALTGGLTGAGLAAAYGEFNFGPLVSKFVLPLGVAPLIPIFLIGFVSPGASAVLRGSARLARSAGVSSRIFRLGTTSLGPRCAVPPAADSPKNASFGTLRADRMERLCDLAHFASAGAVCFARGLNDAPKIVGILLGAGALGVQPSMVAIAAAMVLGGMLGARPVAETMAHKITKISPGQGVIANAITALLVLFASKFGVPVSTTHVSVGAIFGIGAAKREANWRLVGGIVSAWVLTLPVATALAAMIYGLLRFYS